MTDKVPKEEPLDLPPPYSPTENESSASYTPHHSSATSPPDYHTIQEQSGYLGSSSSVHIKQEPHNEFERITRSKGKQRSNNHSLFEDIRYDPSRGPIGNIFNIAERFVGNAANAANVAIGAPPSPSPAEFGNNIARSATLMANNASKAAMGYVEQMMGTRTERREERRERRESRREAKKERRECSRRGESSRSYQSDEASSGSSSPPPPQPQVPYEPYHPNTTADCDDNSATEKLEIKKSNAPLVLEQSWSGRECLLKTSNAHLSVHGSLGASESIELESSNGNVVVDGQILAGKKASIRTSNGLFQIHGESIIANEVDIHISNAPLQLSSFIQAKKISLKTKNGPITIGNISMESELHAKTANAPIEIHIVDIGSGSAKIEVESCNAPVNVYVPSTFSGYFSVKSNSAGSANVVAKSTEQSMIEYQVDERSKKQGTCKNFGNKSSIEVIVKTSNAAATLYI